MADEPDIVVFEGGELVLPRRLRGRREAVLAMPLDRLLAKIARVPASEAADPVAFVQDDMKAMSPVPDDPLAVTCETLSETPDHSTVLAVALPESSAEDVAAKLDEAKINVTRIDAAVFGYVRAKWDEIFNGRDGGARLLLAGEESSIAAIAFDGRVPCAIRAISRGGDEEMRRDTMLFLMEAESSCGMGPLVETVTAGDVPAAAVPEGAGVRALGGDMECALDGVAARSMEVGTANALPGSWREVLEETRFKSKMKKCLAAAGAAWLACVAALVAVPWWISRETSRYETLRAQHRPQYRKVSEKKSQVEAVREVSNHDLGALETLRAVVSCLPEGVELSKWNFKRGERLTFGGTVEDGDRQKVYDFKDALDGVRLSAISGDDDDSETRFFTSVALPNGVTLRNRKAAFNVECSFAAQEEDY